MASIHIRRILVGPCVLFTKIVFAIERVFRVTSGKIQRQENCEIANGNLPRVS